MSGQPLSAEFSSQVALEAEFISIAGVVMQASFGQCAPALTVQSFESIRSGVEMPSLVYHAIAKSGDNAASIKAVAGVVTGWSIFNNSNATIFVKLYDSNVVPNPVSLVPKQTIGITAGTSEVMPISTGLTYVNGIGIAIVQNIGDADDTGVAANSCSVDLFYQ